jgi:hypothetical protein
VESVVEVLCRVRDLQCGKDCWQLFGVGWCF